MGLLKSFFSQTRKPEGVLGKLMVNGMNGSGHAKLADWGMAHLGGIAPSNIAELGCGGGRNAAELMRRYPKAALTALDYGSPPPNLMPTGWTNLTPLRSAARPWDPRNWKTASFSRCSSPRKES